MTKCFEVRKAGFVNKGAAMMLIAAVHELRSRFPKSILSVAPDASMPFEKRIKLGLYHRAELIRFGVNLGRVVELVPERLRKRFGFVTEKEVDYVIDAAGFAYSDQWGPVHVQDLARRVTAWRKAGKKTILLPQAFGPFKQPETRAAMKVAVENADLVFARDEISYTHLREACDNNPKILQAPDFTNLLPAVDDGTRVPGTRPVAFVPNARMLDKIPGKSGGSYIELMAAAIKATQSRGFDVFFLIHEGKDDEVVAQSIMRLLDAPTPIIWPEDPLVAKHVIGQCDFIVASRFHALVSALSMAVPAIGTSWSHKYQELFKDYDSLDYLVQDLEDRASLLRQLEVMCDDANRDALRANLSNKSVLLKEETQQMWTKVFATLET